MSDASSTERSLAASIAAHTSWANTTNRSARTQPAREALWRKFLDQADGDPQRARHLYKAHFKQLALKSARARRRAASAMEAARLADRDLQHLTVPFKREGGQSHV